MAQGLKSQTRKAKGVLFKVKDIGKARQCFHDICVLTQDDPDLENAKDAIAECLFGTETRFVGSSRSVVSMSQDEHDSLIELIEDLEASSVVRESHVDSQAAGKWNLLGDLVRRIQRARS